MAFKGERLYKDPQEMAEALEQYFRTCDARATRVLPRNALTTVEVPDPAPYTVAGMQLAAGIHNPQTWANYKTYEGYKEVLTWAYKVVEEQWTALTARGANNGGAIFYLANVFRGEYTSQMSVNVGGQAGNPMQLSVKTERERLASCSYEELEKIEAIMLEAEKRDQG